MRCLLLLVVCALLANAQFSSVATLSNHLHDAAAVSYNNAIWIIGGNTASIGNTPTAAVVSLAQGASTTTVQASLPQPRMQHAAAVLGGAIFVIGGFVDVGGPGSGAVASVLRYSGGSWVSLAAGSNYPGGPVTYLSATTADDNNIYVFGGSLSGTPSNKLYSFDGSSWTTVQTTGSTPIAVSAPSATFMDNGAAQGSIYFVGGTITASPGRFNQVQVFDYSAASFNANGASVIDWGDCCTGLTCASCPRVGCGDTCQGTANTNGAALTSDNGRVWLFGGSSAATTCTDHISYFSTLQPANLWVNPGFNLPTQLSNFAAARGCDGTFYIVGGITGAACNTYPSNSAIYSYQPYASPLTCPGGTTAPPATTATQKTTQATTSGGTPSTTGTPATTSSVTPSVTPATTVTASHTASATTVTTSHTAPATTSTSSSGAGTTQTQATQAGTPTQGTPTPTTGNQNTPSPTTVAPMPTPSATTAHNSGSMMVPTFTFISVLFALFLTL